MTDLKLSPHETRAIDLRKLRDAQKADFQGNTIPAGATDGSVLWIRIDNVPVMGRLVVIQRHKGIASNYDCSGCPCPTSFSGVVVTPRPVNLVPGGTSQEYAQGRYTDCNGHNSYNYVGATWSICTGCDPSVASVSAGGLVTALAGGTTTILATYGDYCWSFCGYPPPGHCTSTPMMCSGPATVNVVSITGPQTVWWFNGQTPSAYATTITLTATPSGASSYAWSLLAGTDKAVLQNQSGNTIQVRGNDLSTSLNDVTVQVNVTTTGGTKSATRTVTVRGPYKLVPGSKFHSALPGYGYESQIWYTIRDNFNVTMPATVPFTEEWTTNPVPMYTGTDCTGGTNWGLAQFIPIPQGDTTSNSQFYDRISGPGVNNTPAPCPTPTGPQIPLGPLVVQWGQRWRVGTTTSGLGASVQLDTFERFVDHGDHAGITSPAP